MNPCLYITVGLYDGPYAPTPLSSRMFKLPVTIDQVCGFLRIPSWPQGGSPWLVQAAVIRDNAVEGSAAVCFVSKARDHGWPYLGEVERLLRQLGLIESTQLDSI